MKTTPASMLLRSWLAAGVMAAIAAGSARADVIEIGSPLVSLGAVDSASRQVYIYAGGFFPQGVQVTTLSFVDSHASGDLTPLLLEQVSANLFEVVGIGTSEVVSAAAGTQSVAFGLQAGTNQVTGGNFTFGFINATVSGQTVTGSSAGTVDWTTPITAGTGLGGAGTTNQWDSSPSVANITVGLGTTFGLAGTGANFQVNNGDRTYAAAAGADAVPEPASVLMLGGAIGILRTLRRRGSR